MLPFNLVGDFLCCAEGFQYDVAPLLIFAFVAFAESRK